MTAKKNPTTKERIAKVLRVNTYSMAHVIAPHKPVPPIATAPHNDLFQRPVYVPGDGERMQSARPGADAHLAFKSKGNMT